MSGAQVHNLPDSSASLLRVEALPRRRPHRLFKKLALAALGALVGFFVCELLARAMFPAPIVRWPDPQIVYQVDPELKYFHVTNQEGWIDDVPVRINSLGFRGPEVAVPKPANRFRIVALGDSVTLGIGVSENETFSVRLQERLLQTLPTHDFEVVNCGISGYNTRQEAALLERFMSRLEPSLVLLGFYMNDVPDALADSARLTNPTLSPRSGGRGQGEGADEPYAAQGSTRLLTPDMEPGQTLHMHQAPSRVNLLMRQSRAVYCASRTLGKLFHGGEWSSGNFVAELDMLDGKQTSALLDAWEIVENQFRRVRAMAESANLPVGIVVLPCREQVMRDYPNAQYQTKIKQLGEQCGFFVIDPLPTLSEHRARVNDLFVAYDRNHPSAWGHDLIAQAIADYLAQHPDLVNAAPRSRLHPSPPAAEERGRG